MLSFFSLTNFHRIIWLQQQQQPISTTAVLSKGNNKSDKGSGIYNKKNKTKHKQYKEKVGFFSLIG